MSCRFPRQTMNQLEHRFFFLIFFFLHSPTVFFTVINDTTGIVVTNGKIFNYLHDEITIEPF